MFYVFFIFVVLRAEPCAGYSKLMMSREIAVFLFDKMFVVLESFVGANFPKHKTKSFKNNKPQFINKISHKFGSKKIIKKMISSCLAMWEAHNAIEEML